jgi:hypothetical protein
VAQATSSARLRGPVRITMPAAVAYDLKAFQKSVAALVERLGCRTCFSGADCHFQTERDWVISEKQQLSPAARVSTADTCTSLGAGSHNVSVSLAKEVRYDLKQLQAAIGKVVGKLGHPGCCSGFDIAFREEIQYLTVSKDLNVQAVE